MVTQPEQVFRDVLRLRPSEILWERVIPFYEHGVAA
jgi:hypothetical protein